METTIPFSGFYNSIHDGELAAALESIFSDERGNPIPSLVEKAFQLVNWKACHEAYAEKYTECFADEFSLNTLKYKMLISPREYNFTTDRIICEISLEEVIELYGKISIPDLKQRIKDRFTSYDGFISHYPNTLEAWPIDPEDWDHNQVGTLVEAWVIAESSKDFDQWREYEIIGDSSEVAHAILYSNMEPEAERLFKIGDYLRTREARI